MVRTLLCKTQVPNPDPAKPARLHVCFPSFNTHYKAQQLHKVYWDQEKHACLRTLNDQHC